MESSPKAVMLLLSKLSVVMRGQAISSARKWTLHASFMHVWVAVKAVRLGKDAATPGRSRAVAFSM
jgi:hypothetical protein